jgi:hypothetical protein
MLVAMAAWLSWVGNVVADKGPGNAAEREAVRAARDTVAQVRQEIRISEPYPGGARWEHQLRELGRRLEEAGGGAGRYRWFDKALEGFAQRSQEGALAVLHDLYQRLSLLEDSMAAAEESTSAAALPSPQQVKSLLRKRAGARPRVSPRAPEDEPPPENKAPVEGDDPAGRSRRGHEAGPTRTVATSRTALGQVGWLVLAGLILAVLTAAAYLFVKERHRTRSGRSLRAQVTHESVGPEIPDLQEKTPAELWHQAQTTAARGQPRAALRLLYLAVLCILDRKRWVRYEPTRTNGEYLRQLGLAEDAPAVLRAPFEQLTALFESRWYGEDTCAAEDFQEGQRLAEQVRQTAGPA